MPGDNTVTNSERQLSKGWNLAMKSSELREMSDDQLQHELRETQESLFRLRFQAATERLDAPSQLRRLRRTIARIKTIQREREMSAQSEQAAQTAGAAE